MAVWLFHRIVTRKKKMFYRLVDTIHVFIRLRSILDYPWTIAGHVPQSDMEKAFRRQKSMWNIIQLVLHRITGGNPDSKPNIDSTNKSSGGVLSVMKNLTGSQVTISKTQEQCIGHWCHGEHIPLLYRGRTNKTIQTEKSSRSGGDWHLKTQKATYFTSLREANDKWLTHCPHTMKAIQICRIVKRYR